MKINLTSVKAFERSLAIIGLSVYSIGQARNDIKEADRLGLIKHKMLKSRLLSRLKLFESNK